MSSKASPLLSGLGKATRRGVRRCPKCGTVNGTRGLSCKNRKCDMIFKEGGKAANSSAAAVPPAVGAKTSEITAAERVARFVFEYTNYSPSYSRCSRRFVHPRVIETCRLITGDRHLFSVRWSDPSPAAATDESGNLSASRGLVLLASAEAAGQSSKCFVPGCRGRETRSEPCNGQVSF